MGFLKKLDVFRSVNRDQKEGTLFGAIMTFLSLTLIFIFFSRELREYHQEKLTTKLYLLSLSNTLIQVEFDIIIYKLKCEHVVVGEDHGYDDIQLEKIDYDENGCNLKGIYYMQPMDNKLIIRPDMQSTFIDLMMNGDAENSKNDKQRIDFSHKINKFQFGRSTARLTQLSKNYPDIIRVNPLDGTEFHSTNKQDGHSIFLYEINVVGANINGKQEIIYHYSTNTINSMNVQPSITFIHDFSAIGVAYNEARTRTFLEFLTYLFAIIGGILAIVKFFNNFVSGIFRKTKTVNEEIMEMS